MRTIFLGRDGPKRKYAHLHPDGSVTTQTVMDVEPTLERNKRLQNEDRLHEDGVNFLKLPKEEAAKYLYRKIAVNPDYKYLRTYGGRY